jgi:hypothetical protein
MYTWLYFAFFLEYKQQKAISHMVFQGIFFYELKHTLLQPHFEGVVRSPLTLPKMGLGSPWRTPKSRVEPTWGSNYVELRKVGT